MDRFCCGLDGHCGIHSRGAEHALCHHSVFIHYRARGPCALSRWMAGYSRDMGPPRFPDIHDPVSRLYLSGILCTASVSFVATRCRLNPSVWYQRISRGQCHRSRFIQAQVVEACSGLRYLFPLASLAFISAYFFKTSLWKRAVVFVSSVPITIFMNSFRIGAIGVLVEYQGTGAAEGFLHYFEGWVIFM